MKRYESRTCTFAVPADWVAEPPFAFREPGEEGDRMGAQILERSRADMPSAAAYAKDQKPILAELYDGFELPQEGPQRLEGPGEGYAVTFKYLDEEEYPSRGRMVFYTCGPLVCQLFLSGPDGDDPERDRLFEAIARTFAFRDAEVFAGAKPGGLTSEILRMPQAEAAKAWPGPWRKFPRCCVELPLPTGWEVTTDEKDDVVFRRGSAEIRLHRELGENNEADVWLADRLKRLQEQGDRLLGLEQGVVERSPYSVVLYEERGSVRAWKTAAVTRAWNLFWSDQQPLVCTLRAPEAGFNDVRLLFESLIASIRFLDPAEWETRLEEPWLGYVLKGPWKSQGPGLYVKEEERISFLSLNREENHLQMRDLKGAIADSLRKGSAFAQITREDQAEGSLRGAEAFHFALEGRDQGFDDLCLQTAWLHDDRFLYSALVQGPDVSEAQGILKGVLASFSPRSHE